jgi:hypothetical protein
MNIAARLKIVLATIILSVAGTANATDFTIGIDPNIRLRGLSSDQIAQQAVRACNEIAGVCNVRFPYNPRPQILITSIPLPGITIGNYSVTYGQIRLDSVYEEVWTEDLCYCVIVHELLHALLGPTHDESEGSMFKKQVDWTMNLGPTNIKNLVWRYGPPKK